MSRSPYKSRRKELIKRQERIIKRFRIITKRSGTILRICVATSKTKLAKKKSKRILRN